MRYPAREQPPGADRGQAAAVLIATEAVLLWPREVRSPATVADARRWPVFVLVVGDRPRADIRSAAPLLDLIDQPRGQNEPVVVPTQCRWSVVDNRNAVLRAAIRAEVPVRFAAEILLPSRHVLGVLDIAARGGTIGITTARHAAKLSGRVDIRTALQQVVLLSCDRSADLARIAGVLQRTVRVD